MRTPIHVKSAGSQKRRSHKGAFGTVSKLPSGRYRAMYYGPEGSKGRRYSSPTTFTTKRAARKWLATVQAGVITVVTGVAAVPDGLTLPADGGQWASLLYMALVAGALALWAQTWSQAHLTATRAAIVMALEPVFAAFFAVLLGGEQLTRRMVLGGALVLAAMYVVELRSTPRDPAASAADEPPVEALHHDV